MTTEPEMSPKQRPSWLAYVMTTIITIALILLVMEVFLQLTDPWGIKIYQDLDLMIESAQPDEQRGYVLPPGEYKFHNWTATILDDHTRQVAGTNPAAGCQIVMIGDSTTFGHGVSDGQTWVDVLGRNLDDVHLLNAGLSMYNHRNIVGTIADFPQADGYIYLIDDNDVATSFAAPPLPDYQLWEHSFVVRYLWFFVRSYREGSRREFATSETELNSYITMFDTTLANRDDVLVLAWDHGGGLSQLLADAGYDLTFIPPYTETVSLVDIHPSARASQQIGENLLPIVTDFKERVCPSS